MKNAKTLIPLVMIAVLLTACGGGQPEQGAVETQVAALISQQATADAAGAVPQPTVASGGEATGAPPVNTNNGQIQIPQEAAICIPIGTSQVIGTVTDIWSGKSIQVNVNGQSVEVRYIGLDSGSQPADINRTLIEGKQVLLISDVTDVDEYGRLPRYVISADGVFVNLELIRRGAAFPSPEEPDVACKDEFKAAGPQQ